MNKDCHYYGTYYIARVAGFSQEDALEIAWAAQTVDECEIDNLYRIKEKIDEIDKNVFLLTITDPFDDMRDFISSDEKPLDYPIGYRLMALRAIWMPFHFLPGNFRAANKDFKYLSYRGGNTADPIIAPSESRTQQDKDDHKLMCRTSTETCKIIIDNAKKQYDELKDKNKQQALYAIGIVMHVLADTWSHEFFCGSPSYYVNYVEKPDEKFLAKYGKYLTAKQSAQSVLRPSAKLSPHTHTIEKLGHGIAGFFPDWPFVKDYILKPAWLRAAPEGQRQLPKRDNPDRFRDAFCQMLLALLYITGKSFENQWIPYTYEPYRIISQIMRNKKAEEYIGYLDTIYNIFITEKADQTDLWNDLFQNTKIQNEKIYENPSSNQPNILPEYVFKKKEDDSDIYKIVNFLTMAKKHRDVVLTYINEHIPTAFSGSGGGMKLQDVDQAVIKFYEDFPPIIVGTKVKIGKKVAVIKDRANKAKEKAYDTVEDAKDIVVYKANEFQVILLHGAEVTAEKAIEIGKKIGETLVETGETVVNTAKDARETVINTAKDARETVINAAKDARETVVNAAKNVGETVVNAGEGAVDEARYQKEELEGKVSKGAESFIDEMTGGMFSRRH